MPTLTTDSQTWIQDLCRQFSDATGWPLQYTLFDSTDSKRSTDFKADPNWCWSKEISDGDQPVGHLHIDLPENPQADRSFLAVCDLAEITGELLNRLTASNRNLESRTQDVSTLVDVGLSVSREDDLQGALKRLLAAALDLTGFRASGFFLLNSNTEELTLRVSHCLDSQEIPFPRRNLSESQPDLEALSRGVMQIQKQDSPELCHWLPAGIWTGFCVSVQSESGPFGTLWIFDRRSRIPTERERHVLQSIAAQICTVLERAVLLKESETQHRIRRELLSLTDEKTTDTITFTPKSSWFEAAGQSTSRYEIGGDLCELIEIDDRYTVVAIGDACGDSIPAAVVMSAVRGSLRTLTDEPIEVLLQTATIMSRINRSLHAITPAHQFMSMLYGVLDEEEKTFTYTNAGHPTPFMIKTDGETSNLISHGMLLGVVDYTKYESSVVSLSPQELMIGYTDGVSEAMSSQRQMFRSEGILDAIKENANASAINLYENIWSKLETHLTGGHPPDDRSLLVIKLR
jgi:sigma-B regulation protein RsbU (phosphoserine phosphatase)